MSGAPSVCVSSPLALPAISGARDSSRHGDVDGPAQADGFDSVLAGHCRPPTARPARAAAASEPDQPATDRTGDGGSAR
jgi:hypothetical protein